MVPLWAPVTYPTMPERLVVEPAGEVIARKVRYALTLRERTVGLMGQVTIEPGSSLIFERAKQIHTFGMRCRIDVVFCDKGWKILHIVRSMQPWRMSRFVLRARFVVELPEGAARRAEVGDRLRIGGQPDKRR